MTTARVPTRQARAAAGWSRWLWASAVMMGCAAPPLCQAQSQTTAVPLAASNAAAPTMLRMGLTANTHLVYEPRPYLPPNEFHARTPAQPSLALEFRSAKKDQGPRGLLRMQLSGDSVLHFRPRGGGMTVTYRSPF